MSKRTNSRGNLKEILASAGALALIAGVTTAALAGTNALTKDTIAGMNEKAETAARRQVIDADSFDKKALTDDGQKVTYYAAEKDGKTVGYVFTAVTTGKSSGMVVMTGISSAGQITGVKVTDNKETAGYVDKVTKGGLLKAFAGKKASGSFTLGKDIDGISQATKTSTGVTKGVNKAVWYYTTYVKGAK